MCIICVITPRRSDMKRITVSQTVEGATLAIRGVPYPSAGRRTWGRSWRDTMIRDYGAVHERQPGRWATVGSVLHTCSLQGERRVLVVTQCES